MMLETGKSSEITHWVQVPAQNGGRKWGLGEEWYVPTSSLKWSRQAWTSGPCLPVLSSQHTSGPKCLRQVSWSPSRVLRFSPSLSQQSHLQDVQDPGDSLVIHQWELEGQRLRGEGIARDSFTPAADSRSNPALVPSVLKAWRNWVSVPLICLSLNPPGHLSVA